jgi:hypothetical protein
LAQITVFRQDAGGTPVSIAGTGHLILAGVSSVLTLAATVLCGVAFRREASWMPLSKFCFAAAGALVLSAPAAALSTGGAYMGLFERITIGVFMTWVVVVSAYALRRAARIRTDG